MGRVVLDKARTASYVPYTRGAQDIIETMFATQVQFEEWPLHVHAQLGKVDYKQCYKLSRKLMQRQPESAAQASLGAFEAVDARMLTVEQALIAQLTKRSSGGGVELQPP